MFRGGNGIFRSKNVCLPIKSKVGLSIHKVGLPLADFVSKLKFKKISNIPANSSVLSSSHPTTYLPSVSAHCHRVGGMQSVESDH